MGERSPITLVLGVGNLLMSDEGVGVHVIRQLVEQYRIPEEIQILDGGTLGMDLLYYLEGVENLLIIDAVETGEPPGTIIRLEGDQVPSFLSIKMSPHEIGIPDMLAAARLKDLFPSRLILIGVQPQTLEISTELSELMSTKVDAIIGYVFEQLEAWGHSLDPV